LHVRSIGAIQNLPTLKLAQLYSGMTFVWKPGWKWAENRKSWRPSALKVFNINVQDRPALLP
jgi:hypothetical protein